MVLPRCAMCRNPADGWLKWQYPGKSLPLRPSGYCKTHRDLCVTGGEISIEGRTAWLLRANIAIREVAYKAPMFQQVMGLPPNIHAETCPMCGGRGMIEVVADTSTDRDKDG